MLTRRDVLRRLERIQASHEDIACKSRRLKELESAVSEELKEIESGVLSLADELSPKARAKMLLRLDRLRACLDEISAALEEAYRPVELKLHAKTTAQ